MLRGRAALRYVRRERKTPRMGRMKGKGIGWEQGAD